jgi:hypothetical protein
MGLDISHGCWHGAYSAFWRWRAMLADAIGMDLDQMAGYGGEREWPTKTVEPLVVLLDHSDCDGWIPWQDCGPLADRLEVILAALPEDDWGHLADPHAKTRRFIDGLREAAAAREDVEFD